MGDASEWGTDDEWIRCATCQNGLWKRRGDEEIEVTISLRGGMRRSYWGTLEQIRACLTVRCEKCGQTWGRDNPAPELKTPAARFLIAHFKRHLFGDDAPKVAA